MHNFERFDNLGRSLISAARTLTGNAAERLELEGGDGTRLGLLIHNHSTSLKVFVKLSRLASGETLSATDKHFVVLPESTLLIRAGHEIHLWAMNSSGDGTTSQLDAVELR